jgi:UDP-N-acetylmuramate--alanine ligase
MFLGLSPRLAIITNIEFDHPDCYPTPKEYYQAFRDFTGRLPSDGTLLACADDEGTTKLLEEVKADPFLALSYGFSPHADYQIQQAKANSAGGISFNALYREADGSLTHLAKVELQVPGMHNASNALAALAIAHLLGLPVEEAAEALNSFRGTGRRFELRGSEQGITVIDDYAHHPTEIRTTLMAARMRYPDQQLWVVWQPHTYSRTQALLSDFAGAFSQADHVIVTEVFAAREPVTSFSAAQVVQAMSHPDVTFIPTLSAVSAYLLTRLQPADVLLVFSAGDADQVSVQVLDGLKQRKETND